MAKLNKKISLRVPDRLAIGVALILTLSATGNLVSNAFESPMDAQGAPTTVMPTQTEQVDPTSDDAAGSPGLAARFLLFRHG